jgi:hypothetical protein
MVRVCDLVNGLQWIADCYIEIYSASYEHRDSILRFCSGLKAQEMSRAGQFAFAQPPWAIKDEKVSEFRMLICASRVSREDWLRGSLRDDAQIHLNYHCHPYNIVQRAAVTLELQYRASSYIHNYIQGQLITYRIQYRIATLFYRIQYRLATLFYRIDIA